MHPNQTEEEKQEKAEAVKRNEMLDELGKLIYTHCRPLLKARNPTDQIADARSIAELVAGSGTIHRLVHHDEEVLERDKAREVLRQENAKLGEAGIDKDEEWW